jgi:hypothetical protein
MAATEMTLEQKKMLGEAVASMTDLLDAQLAEHLVNQIKKFSGSFDTLESALGALIVGRVVGWRVLKLLHSPRTYKLYENELGLKFSGTFPWSNNPVMPERGPFSGKSVALQVTDKLDNFWDVVRTGGDVPKKVAESI